jgi:hypothetical protein
VRTKSLALFGLATAVLFGGAGCDDDDDDEPELFVVNVTPADQLTNVSTNTAVILRFSIAVDPNSYTGTNQIIMVDQSNSQIPVSITPTPSQGASEFVTITPATPLATNLTYGVAVREFTTDLNGHGIRPPFSMTFSTGPVISAIPGFPPFNAPPGPVAPPGAPGTFTPTGQLVTPVDTHLATRLLNGNVLITGGRLNGGAPVRQAQMYDPVTGQWRAISNGGKGGLNFRRLDHTQTLLDNGTVLVTGGTDGTVVHDTAEIYDPSTDSFTVVSSRMTVDRQRHAAVKIDNGNVLIIGGVSSTQGNLNSMEIYDTTTGQFTNVQSTMTISRDRPSAQRQPDGRVFINGGRTPAFLFGFVIITVNSGETYSPAAGTPGTSGSIQPNGNRMATTRWFHSVTNFGSGPASGIMLIAGGATNNPWSQSLQNADLYDYLDYNGAGGYRPVAQSMATSRWDHEATFLNNGTILITGGFNGTGLAPVTPICEVFMPFANGSNTGAPFRGIDLSGAFIPTQTQLGVTTRLPLPPLSCGLSAHTATLLLNGTVLIAGGQDAIFCVAPVSVSLAWIYSP